jgi:hypothetical protein
MNIEVRRALDSDVPAIGRFLPEVHGDAAKFKGAERFDWQFRNCPFPLAGGLPVWIAVDGDRVVGLIAAQGIQVWLDGVQYPGAWLVDLIVNPAYRGHSLGQRLYHAAKDCSFIVMGLNMAQASRRIGLNEGCVQLGPVQRFNRLTRPSANDVKRYVLHRTRRRKKAHAAARAVTALQGHRLAHAGLYAALSLRDAFRPLPGSSDLEVSEVTRFGHDAESLWHRVKPQIRAGIPRVPEYLNWRFFQCPQVAYRAFEARRGPELAGFVVVRRPEPVELSVGIIADVFAAPGDRAALECLISHGTRFLGKDVSAVHAVASCLEVQACLRRLGFHAAGTMTPTLICGDEAVRSKCESLKDEWYFTAGDHDVDQVWVA